MKFGGLPVITVLGLAAVLWVVPSIGTQGMGTIGQRFAHADRGLATDRSNAATRLALSRADTAVETALVR